MEYKEILDKANIIYNYLNINSDIKKADMIIGFGCMDKTIPLKCASLYKSGFGKIIVFSGNVGKGTMDVLNITEAEYFKNIAINEGIQEDNILLENKATNTYENYKYTKKLLENMSINYKSVVIVQKPYVKRRLKAIADVEMNNKEVYVTSMNLSLEEFINVQKENKTMTFDEIINELVGEISIILTTPKYGIQSKQIIDNSIKEAYNYLVNQGYNKCVVTDEDIKKVIKKWKSIKL